MTLIGMLHYRLDPIHVRKAFACAAAAKMEGVQFIYFSYGAVDFENRSIKGWEYADGKWLQNDYPFPDVIINISGPKTDYQSKVRKQLKDMIPFTSHPVGNKMKVYRKVKKGETFAEYLIPSFKLKSLEKVKEKVTEYEKIVIKPYSGNKGKKVMFLESSQSNEYVLTTGEEKKTLNEEEVEILIEELKREKKYLIQPFIECKTKSGLTYDFRLHVQKNGLGEWEITLIYPRISGSKKLVSNISSGGYRGELDTFLLNEFGDWQFDIRRTLDHFAVSFSEHLDELYNKSFDELGIDVGLDQNKKLWIFEVNWRPGSKHREFEVAKRLIPYALFLTNRKDD
ncbi:YheC/YheD family protein [Bacillus sp. BGMRC 2118]|nr:YheC/YheD family protein [Bacillus sp. BGMRC 2118]